MLASDLDYKVHLARFANDFETPDKKIHMKFYI